MLPVSRCMINAGRTAVRGQGRSEAASRTPCIDNLAQSMRVKTRAKDMTARMRRRRSVKYLRFLLHRR